MQNRISAIAAIGEKRELGKNNQLLWHIPGELARFKQITTGHPIIMGRKTYESIGRVLPNRTNIIITRDKNFTVPGAVVVASTDEALKKAKEAEGASEIFVIGGGQIFSELLPQTERLYLTLVHKSFDADVYFPDYTTFTKEIERKDMVGPEFDYTFLTVEK